jgi:hypothetical protein
MKRIALALATVAALVAAPLAPLHAAPKTPASITQIPITGTFANGGIFTGTFTLQRFATSGGQVVAVGTVAGTATQGTGAAAQVLTGISTVALPLLTPPTASCDILHLNLGPLDLDLLGLQVHLNEVVLDITAVPGAGNLLGNLLCSVANLLNNPTGLARVLNQILDILQAL